MHYRLYYALYLYENDSSLTASDLGSAFESGSGQQSIRKYRYLSNLLHFVVLNFDICNIGSGFRQVLINHVLLYNKHSVC